VCVSSSPPDSGLPVVPVLVLSPVLVPVICAAAAGGLLVAGGIVCYKKFKQTSKYYTQLIVENRNKIFNVQNNL